MPVGLLETILEYRAFAAAKQQLDRNDPKAEIPDTPMFRLARLVEFELARQDLEGE